MFILMIIAFIAGYGAIASENNLKVNKAAVALITGMTLWTLYVIGGVDILSSGSSSSWNDYLIAHPDKNSASDMIHFITHIEILEHLMDIASILFFLIGAMTIVEIIDRHQGLKILTDKITTRDKRKLLWIICFLTFILSALLDNLTTTIVMVAVIRKLMSEKTNRWIFTSMVIISANAGGAWSPVGDVTTIMLWIGGQVTTMPLIKEVLIPSLVTMLLPLIIMSRKLKKVSVLRPYATEMEPMEFTYKERLIILIAGVSCLIFVPIFKTFTHLPPYVGMLLSLGVLWIITDIVHKSKGTEVKKHYDAARIIRKIDTATILYFLGILTAVSALQSAGQLALMSGFLDQHLGNVYFIDLAIGLLSSTIDNSALVAGAIGMYPLETANATGYAANFMQDGDFWSFLAYCAGTGGNILIIGSAAGVAAMGLEKINFIWYMKNFSRMALTGYFGGAIVYYLITLL